MPTFALCEADFLSDPRAVSPILEQAEHREQTEVQSLDVLPCVMMEEMAK